MRTKRGTAFRTGLLGQLRGINRVMRDATRDWDVSGRMPLGSQEERNAAGKWWRPRRDAEWPENDRAALYLTWQNLERVQVLLARAKSDVAARLKDLDAE